MIDGGIKSSMMAMMMEIREVTGRIHHLDPRTDKPYMHAHTG
jgi:hypothetical protein